MKLNIRLLYLYLFSFVGLIIVVIGSVGLVNLGIKTFIFPDADVYVDYRPEIVTPDGKMAEVDEEELKARQETEQRRSKQRALANNVAMIIVGAPLYLYHWKTIQKEEKTG